MGSLEKGCLMADGEGSESNLALPEAFLEFLEHNGLDPSIYALQDAIPRYIRVKPGCESQLIEIKEELGCELDKVCWLPSFYAIPPQIQIASSEAYKSGKIYGMDAASGAAVLALNITPGDHVLDLCAAPGAKLCMLSDLLGSLGSLTGVDVARHRLAACRTMLLKYGLGDCCRLFVADGTSFSLLPVRSNPGNKSHNEILKRTCNFMVATNAKDPTNIFTEWSSKRSWKDRKNAAKARNASGTYQAVVATSEPELIFYGKHSGVVGLSRSELFTGVDDVEPLESGYDKVLVDAECTHDGSVKHIQKFEHWGWKTLQHRVLNAKRTDNLMQLQLQLLSNGFRLLKVGGSLVYSTCSLTVAQNEDVVEQFLSRNPLGEIQDIDDAEKWPCRSGGIPKSLRFDPKTSQTSGLFIVKLRKLAA